MTLEKAIQNIMDAATNVCGYKVTGSFSMRAGDIIFSLEGNHPEALDEIEKYFGKKVEKTYDEMFDITEGYMKI